MLSEWSGFVRLRERAGVCVYVCMFSVRFQQHVPAKCLLIYAL